MHLFYLKQSYETGENFKLEGDDFFRLSHILRYKVGSIFVARDPKSYLYNLKIESINKTAIILSVVSKKIYFEKPPLEIELWQVMPKNNLEEIIKMAIESGVSRIVPITSHFSVVKDKKNEAKIKRFQKIAEESIMQSGSFHFKELASISSLTDIIASLNGNELVFFAHQEILATKVSLLDTIKNSVADKVIIIIGGEGGFATDEVELMLNKNCKNLYFGDTILRSEHAALFLLGAIKMILQEVKGE